MASRTFAPGMRTLSNASFALRATRNFQTSSRRLIDATAAAPLPARKPIGAFRGGYEAISSITRTRSSLTDPRVYRLFGFLLGSSLAGGGIYYYVLTEYKASNDQLMEDIYVRLCI